MINIKKAITLALFATAGLSASTNAQCFEPIGSSANMLTSLLNRQNSLIVNNDLNTVVFIHRNDNTVFGGDNGIYRYDISTDNGATWQTNLGGLNTGSAAGVNAGRYPQVGLYNPPSNTDPANATLVYHGPTVAVPDWNGYVSGSLLLDGAAAPTENYNQAGVTNTLLPGGFCQSAPGTFWTVDIISDDNFSGTGFRILKGTYSGGDVNWTVNAELTPDFNTDFGYAQIADWNMAFDPTGINGWMVALTHLNGLTGTSYRPVFYNTTDGGATWNGPVQLDLSSFSSITNVESDPTCSPEVDIEVDMNGNPHALIGVFKATTGFYGVNPSAVGHLFDFTNNGASWSANNVGQLSYHSLIFPGSNYLYNRPQISRSDDGSKMVFTYTESDVPSSQGVFPNLKAVTYDVASGNISCPVIYSLKCPSILDGQMYQTTVSPNMIENAGVLTVPVVLTIANASGDGVAPAQHYYLNDLSFTVEDFTNAANPSSLTISTNGSTRFCAGGSVDLTASASGSYLWNTGETTQTITATGGNYWVVNPNESYCIGSSNSITVTQVETPFLYPTATTICPGASVDIYVFSFNTYYSSFLWSNGATTDYITVNTPGTYSVLADGCPSATPVELIAVSSPSNDKICNAQALTIGTVTPFDITCATVEAGEPVPPLDPFFNPQTQDGWNDDSYTGTPVINNTVWFSFIAPQSGAVNILTDGFDTQLALYSSSNYTCTGNLTLISANDDGGAFGASLINRAYCLQKGKRYFIQVDGALYGYQFSGTILVTAVNDKVTICHKGNSLTVSGCALAAHLAHGDVIGDCPSVARISASNAEDVTSLSLAVYPNPTDHAINVSFTSDNEEEYTMTLVDITGRILMSETQVALIGENEKPLDLQNLTTGIYFLIIHKGENVMQTRVIKE